MICVSIQEPTTEVALARMEATARWADLVEIRLDGMVRPDLERLFRRRGVPTIATCRPEREGGRWTGEEGARLERLRGAARAGAAWIDVERFAVAALGALPGRCRRLVSHHDFAGMPRDLRRLLRELEAAGGDAVKVAAVPRGMADVLALMALPGEARGPVAVVGMGPAAAPTRILARLFGGAWTYASPAPGRETASGQIPAQVLAERYRASALGRRTRVYGLAGDPVGHSIGPAVWNGWLRAARRDAVYVPFLCRDEADLKALLAWWRLDGLSVTIPHKVAAARLARGRSEAVRATGAANTLFRMRGVGQAAARGWFADNTDLPALVCAVERLLRSAGMRTGGGGEALVLGAGGAARAAVRALLGLGFGVTVSGRTDARAREMAEEFGVRGLPVRAVPWGELGGLRPLLLVNATPVGMSPGVGEMPVPGRFLRPGLLVFDTIYNPAETRLVVEARRRGAVAAGGLDMFVRQAILQARCWTGRAPAEGAWRARVGAARAGE